MTRNNDGKYIVVSFYVEDPRCMNYVVSRSFARLPVVHMALVMHSLKISSS